MRQLGLKTVRSWKTALILTLTLGLVLRLSFLGEVPAGFHEDEAAFGYNAYSILKTGLDEYGNRLPLVLKSFGDYKPALYAYLTIPFIAIFDLTPFSIRIVSALFGTASILVFFLLINKILKRKDISVISAFLLSISPWHINLSRTVSEVVIATFFILLTLFLLENIKVKSSIKIFVFAVIFSILAMRSYIASLLFTPMIIFLSLGYNYFLEKSSLYRKDITLFLSIIALLVVGSIFLFSADRFQQVNIFSHPETQLYLEEQIRQSEGQNIYLTRAMHNKLVSFGRTFLSNYTEYFSFDFLFLNGGFPMRQHIPDVGLFYLWQAPFLLLGLFSFIKKKSKQSYFFLLWWAILLIPSAITFDEIPNVYRSLVVIFPMLVFISEGILVFVNKIREKKSFGKIITLTLVLIIVWEFVYYLNQYYVHQEKHRPWHRGYAYKELSEFINDNKDNYEKFVVTKGHHSPYIYLLFHSKHDPKKYILEGSPRDLGHNIGFSNYLFSDYDCPLYAGKDGTDEFEGNPNYLYVNRGDCFDPIENVEVVKTVNWQDGTPAFKLLKYIVPGEDFDV